MYIVLSPCAAVCLLGYFGAYGPMARGKTRASSEEANTPEAQWFWIKLIWTGLYTCDEEFFKWKEDKNTQDCQKLKFYQIQINSNINQYFLTQFWCWSWRNGLDYSYIPFFVVYGKSHQGITPSCTSQKPTTTAMLSQWLGRRECRLRLCNSLCRTELMLLR